MLRLSLAARITMITVVALLALWIGIIALFYRSQGREAEGARATPRQVAALVALMERTAPADRPLLLDAVATRTLQAALAPGETVRQPPDAHPVEEEVRLAYAAALGDRPLTVAAVPGFAAQHRFPRLFARSAAALELRIGLETGETLIVTTRTPVLLSRLGLPVGFGAGLLGTLVALATLILMHRETRPIARIAAAVDRMGLGPAAAPVPLPATGGGAPEVRALAAAFDRLQTRLAQLLRARMAMLGGISHDVRTFATRLRLRVDHIPEGAERERAIGDIADMIRLLDDALLASRAGAGELAEELVELDQIVRAEVEDRRAAGAAIDLRTGAAPAGFTVLGDRLALRRIVANLADNALKYGRVAHLAIEADAQTATLTVDDEGPGIPPERRELLLEPFVRLEGSRSRGTGGAGLGLAIVRNLAEAHGGTIAIGTAPGGGARFTVRLPVFRAG